MIKIYYKLQAVNNLFFPKHIKNLPPTIYKTASLLKFNSNSYIVKVVYDKNMKPPFIHSDPTIHLIDVSDTAYL